MTDSESRHWERLRALFGTEGVRLGQLPPPPRGVVRERLSLWLFKQLHLGNDGWATHYLSIARGLRNWARFDLPADVDLLRRLRHVSRHLRAAQWFLPESAAETQAGAAIRNSFLVALTDPRVLDDALASAVPEVEPSLLRLLRCYVAALVWVRQDGSLEVQRERVARVVRLHQTVLANPREFALVELTKLKRPGLTQAHLEKAAEQFAEHLAQSLDAPLAPLPWLNVEGYAQMATSWPLMPEDDLVKLRHLRGFGRSERVRVIGDVRKDLDALVRSIDADHPDPDLHVSLCLDHVLHRAPTWRTTYRRLLQTAAENTWSRVVALARKARYADDAALPTTAPFDVALLDVSRGIERVQRAAAAAAGVDEITYREALEDHELGRSPLTGRQKGYVLLRERYERDRLDGVDGPPTPLGIGRPKSASLWELRARRVLTPVILRELAGSYPTEVRAALAGVRADLAGTAHSGGA